MSHGHADRTLRWGMRMLHHVRRSASAATVVYDHFSHSVCNIIDVPTCRIFLPLFDFARLLTETLCF